MGKSRHYRPEERSIHLAKPVAEKATKYKRDLFKTEDEDDFECLDEWTDDQWEDLKNP